MQLTLITAVLALMRLSRSPLLQAVSWGYTWVFHSVPLILPLLLWYNLAYLYRSLDFGIPFGPSFASVETLSLTDKFGAAILGLGLHQAAYSAEIVRAGILSVDQGQLEAAASLGIPKRRQTTRIVLPQAMRAIVPTAVNEVIGLFKGTSIVYVLALGELFYTVSVIYGRTQRVLPMLIAVATAKGNGLAEAFTAAINHAIDDGTYQQVLDRWGLGAEAIDHAETNPPGLGA